jgi:hypothetical protein
MVKRFNPISNRPELYTAINYTNFLIKFSINFS